METASIIACSSQSRSSSLMLVLARVRSSTRLTITAQAVEGPGWPFFSGLCRQHAGHHHGIFRDLADKGLAAVAVDDLGGGAEKHAHRQYRALAHDDALGDFRARADEAIVLDDHGLGLQRLEHAADADPAGNMHALADLGAGADRRPGVDHGAFIDIGAEIDKGWHQHDVPGDEGGTADDGAGNGAKAGVAKPVFAPAVELRRHLVPPRGLAGAAGNRAHVVEAERQQHRLLQPLIDLPFAAGLALGHACLALVEQIQRVIHGLADFAFGRGRDAVAGVERGVDGGFERGERHRAFLEELGWAGEGLLSEFGTAEVKNTPRSWPGLSRPSTSFFPSTQQDVDARDKPGHDERCQPAAASFCRNPVRSSVT